MPFLKMPGSLGHPLVTGKHDIGCESRQQWTAMLSLHGENKGQGEQEEKHCTYEKNGRDRRAANNKGKHGEDIPFQTLHKDRAEMRFLSRLVYNYTCEQRKVRSFLHRSSVVSRQSFARCSPIFTHAFGPNSGRTSSNAWTAQRKSWDARPVFL